MTYFKMEISKTEEQTFPICQEASHQGRKLAWCNRELLQEFREKRGFMAFGRRGRQLRKNTMMLDHVEGKLER